MRAIAPALIVVVALFASGPSLAASEAVRSELIKSAELWEVRSRDDLAVAAYEKLLLIEPTNSEAMLRLGLLRIRENKMQAANQLVQRLNKIQPKSLAARQLADAYRVATSDRLKMATIRRLAQTNQTAEAIRLLKELFPDGPPTAELGVEYFRLIGSTDAGWKAGRAGLTQLAREYSENPRYRLALARFLINKTSTRAEGLKILNALSRDPDANQVEIADLRKEALSSVASQSDPNAPASQADRLRAQSETDLAEGKQGLALKKLEAAVDLAPNDPWIRFSLAKLYVQLGLPSQARSLMQEGVSRAPQDEEMRYAQALLLSNMEDEEGALAALATIPKKKRSEGMKALDGRVHVNLWRKQLKQYAAAGDSAGVEQVLKTAEAAVGRNPVWVGEVATSWMELGQSQKALALMTKFLGQPESARGSTLLVWAEVLNEQADDARLTPLLVKLADDKNLNVESQQAVNRLQQSLLLRRVDQLRVAGQYDQAVDLIDKALRRNPDDIRLLDARADVLSTRADTLADSGKAEEAVALYRKLLERKPDDIDLMLSYARSLRINGQAAAASKVLDDVQQRVVANDVESRLSLVRQRLSLDQMGKARETMQGLLKQAPADPTVLVQAGRVERADGNYDLSADYFRRARDAEILQKVQLKPGQNQTASQEEMDRLERRRNGFISAGLNPRDKPGSPGVSQFNQFEAPIELVVPVGYEGHFFAHFDTVLLNADTLPALYNDAAFYGKVQAFGPTSLANFPNGAEQKANGVAIGLGYETDDLRLDLGSTPIGFPVVDVVGGIKYSSSWGETDYSLDLSRRPITSSLLSYSGARDPVTGEIWGGVRTTGLDLRVGRDFGRLGTSFTTGFHRLTGRNVADNNFFSARAVTDWLFINDEDTKLSLGLALTHWRYRDNLGGYTFGQGGYYSPQSYTALALPLDWSGRIDKWSYRLRPSVSYSVSRTKDSPFYPTNSTLQAMAATSTLPPGFTRPVTDGGSGSGFGYAFKGAIEYQVLPDYFIGGAYDLDRSDFYTPNSTIVYFRHTFKDWVRPVPFPPRPPKSYSDF